MFFTTFKRITKNGIVSFWRNGWVSVATVLVMVMTLFMVGSLFIGKAVLLNVLSQLQDKVDITVYFKTDAGEQDILTLQDSISKMDEVSHVDYISRDEALNSFINKHSDNILIIQSLDELDDNPLGASLNIKAKNPSEYESISTFLEAGLFSAIDKINYKQNKMAIDRLSNILQTSQNLGTGISIVLAFMALLVTFNTIRLAIYTSREEIKVMRLVGASNRYICSPFMVEGVLYGVISTIIAVALFYPLTLWLGPFSESFLGGFNVFQYYMANLVNLLVIMFVVGVFLGVFSSWVATRRYLRA